MARKIVHQLIDDLSGTVLDAGKGETVSFSLDGVGYEIDLTDENAAELRASLQQYISAGRRIGRGSAAPAGRRSAGRREDLAKVREWAAAQGHRVSDRGRVSAQILAEYDAAH